MSRAPKAGATPAEGYVDPPARISSTSFALPDPLTKKQTCLAALISGNVNVMRLEENFGT